MARPRGGPYRLCIDKDAIAHEQARLSRQVVGYGDRVILSPILLGHYKSIRRIYMPILRFLKSIEREGCMEICEDGNSHLDEEFRAEFDNDDDLYLIEVSLGTRCRILISDDTGVVDSRTNVHCLRVYRLSKPKLDLLFAREY